MNNNTNSFLKFKSLSKLQDKNSWFAKSLKIEFKSFMSQWNFEWFVHLTFKNIVKYSNAQDILKKWRIELCKSESIQIAYKGVFTSYPRPHIHILMFGLNESGKTLLDVDENIWMKKWGNKSEINRVYDSDGAIGYLLDQNTPTNNHELFDYNIKLLNKCKIKNLS